MEEAIDRDFIIALVVAPNAVKRFLGTESTQGVIERSEGPSGEAWYSIGVRNQVHSE